MADCAGALVVELEPGMEVQFCPVQNLPISRGGRVRTLPGFHLLSLGAGREALARGSYQAFGQKFVCNDLEYLHPDDRVFICAEDHKAFLNQMSMQYHRYICHELSERKAERKRLRERAAERQARSAAHAQQRRNQAQQQAAGAKAATEAATPLATNDPYLADAASGTKVVDDPYGAAAEDPYLVDSAGDTAAAEAPSEGAATPAQAAPTSQGASTKATGAPPATGAIAKSAAAQRPTTALVPVQVAAASAAPPAKDPVPAATQNAVVLSKAGTTKAPPVAAVDTCDEEDLYGDIGGPATKKSKTSSTYASAIGKMLNDDFDDDD
mmetsp:Transcript_11094/g.29409  ORF Transcript_11094/g.29409 Transcript_11094/m.29409 type:complete len:325 (-) Transcript_11094:63-1037(-)